MAKIYNQVDGSMTVVHTFEGKTQSYSVDKTHPNYPQLQLAFKEDRLDDFCRLTKTSEGTRDYIEKDSLGKSTGLTLVGEDILWHGKKLHNTMVERIMGMRSEGYNVDSMLKFLENLLQNSSNRAVNELYEFLENRNLPITEDGCFLSYKSVDPSYHSKVGNNNLTLIHGEVNDAGQINNAVGQVVECVRNEVDDERGNECSKGLHVGGLQYSGPSGWYHRRGDHVVIVKVNPKDVVSVPKDHNAQKVRVCRYEVIDEYEYDLPDYTTEERVNNCFENYVDEYYASLEDEKEPIDLLCLDDLYEGLNISFSYAGKTRYVRVDEVLPDLISARLLMHDPSFTGTEVQYRNFRKSAMFDISTY